MTAIIVLAEATLTAAAHQVAIKGLEVDAGELSEALKSTIKTNLDRIMAEWREATEARISEAWLRQMVNTQAHELALEALKEIGIMI